ncbi:hypothetical protein CL634_05795 [bacterium]|nr:hypothetical protein [bacterium]
MNKMGQDPNCDPSPSLLDIETIKQRVKDEYGLIECIETSTPNLDGLGTNKDKPFEKANLGGAVLLTVRTYVLEVMLRSIFSFYYYRFKDASAIDSLLISYIAGLIKQDVTRKEFMGEFKAETLDLYNRNVEHMNPPLPETQDFDVALEYFVRWQIYGVSNRLSKTVGAIGDISLDARLLLDNPPADLSWIPPYNVPGGVAVGGHHLGMYTAGTVGQGPVGPVQYHPSFEARIGNDAAIADIPGWSVPIDWARQLLGRGALSNTGMSLYDWDGNDCALTKVLPLGFLFREYFGKHRQGDVAASTTTLRKARIWSREAPFSDPTNIQNPVGESWPVITAGETVSECKSSLPKPPLYPGLQGLREIRMLELCGFIDSNWTVVTTQSFIEGSQLLAQPDHRDVVSVMNPQPVLDSVTGQPTGEPLNTLPVTGQATGPSTLTSFYDYGVSFWEQRAMSTLFQMICAAIPDWQATGIAANSGIVNTFQMHLIPTGQSALVLYPGFLFFDKTVSGGGIGGGTGSPFAFGYNFVWDNTPWNGSGTEPPVWIREGYGESYGSAGWYRPPITVDAANKRINNGALYSADPPYRDVMHTWNGNHGTRISANDADAHWNDARSPQSHHKYLQYVMIDGVKIGPFRVGRVSGAPNGKWKLINLKFEYNDGPHMTNTPSNWIPRAQSNGYAPQELNMGLSPGASIQTPQPVGPNFRDPNYFKMDLHNPAHALRTCQLPDPPGGGPNEPTYKKLLNRANDLLANGMPYLSLLDFDLISIRGILTWERDHVQSYHSGRYGPGLTTAQRNTAFNKWNLWITFIDQAIADMKKANEGRELIKRKLIDLIAENGIAPVPGNPNINPGKSFENGNFIKEFYVRVKELPYQGIPDVDATYATGLRTGETLTGIDNVLNTQFGAPKEQFKIPIERAKWTNSNYVDRANIRSNFEKGVVNIDSFQFVIDQLFNSNGFPSLPSRGCQQEKLTKALIQDMAIFQDCGEAMAAELGIRLPAESTEWVLGDFFESVSVGVRLCYVVPPKDFIITPGYGPSTPSWSATFGGTGANAPCFRDGNMDPARLFFLSRNPTTPLEKPFDNIRANAGPAAFPNHTSLNTSANWADVCISEKAYYVYEQCDSSGNCVDQTITPGTVGRSPQPGEQGQRFVHIVPLVCSEIEIDPLTPMKDIANTGNTYTETKWDPAQMNTMTTPVGFFRYHHNQNYGRLLGQLMGTEEYKMLFKYMFPIDRMLALNIMYASEYLRSFKGVNEMFDGTKIRLRDLFFTLYQSSNIEADGCGPSNLDIQIGAMNGDFWAGLAATIALMILKTVVLIFKGFVEMVDINIAVSKMIRDSIHVINKLIAQGQVMANQAQQLGAATGQAVTDLANIGQCKTDPAIPPDEWFDPIDDNFIPEPQIMFISLALLPITLLPLLWPGLPITPFGLAYWGLDWRPEPKWLNSMPPADWLDKLFNKEVKISSAASAPCEIDVGLPPPSSNELK